MSNWYDNPSIGSEKAILTKTIKFYNVKDIEAEFLIPILTPTQDNSSGNSSNEIKRAPNTKSQKGKKLVTSSYTASNNIKLTIPKYMVYQFYDAFMPANYIPKGTEFIITGLGDTLTVDDIRIIGFFKLGEGD